MKLSSFRLSRDWSGLSLAKAAMKIGISESKLSRIETYISPASDEIKELMAKEYRVRLEFLGNEKAKNQLFLPIIQSSKEVLLESNEKEACHGTY